MARASRAAALRCNQVVECIDLGIEHREGPLAVSVVGANRGSLSRLYRVKKDLAVGTATIRLLSTVAPARARDRGGGSRDSHLGFLAARRAGIGGKRWREQYRNGGQSDTHEEEGTQSDAELSNPRWHGAKPSGSHALPLSLLAAPPSRGSCAAAASPVSRIMKLKTMAMTIPPTSG
jgi:hypothetical protein